jgi:DNA-cytosine methyltransferase
MLPCILSRILLILTNNIMKILSLFDGMSVAQQALKNIGADVEAYYASEIDEYAKAVTQSNFPETIQLGSVTDITWFNIPELKFATPDTNKQPIDIMVGGSPCQDLSIAKKGREGLKGSRSGLFWEYVRIRDEVKPKYFILENVNSMPKEAKDTISEALGVEPVMINASLVSAQNRKRLFWVGKWNGEKYEQVEIPQPEDRGILLKDILEENVDEKYFVKNKRKNTLVSNRPQDADKHKANTLLVDGTNPTIKMRDKSLCIDANYHKGTSVEHYIEKGTRQLVPQRIGSFNSGGQGDRIYSQDGKSVSLSANGGGRGAKTGLYCISSTQKHATITIDKSSPMVSAMGMGGGHVPMIASDDTQIRKLTPTECLRLQSMPDDYFDKATYKNKPISNTQRYKMCGNAFNCKVVEHILKYLI